MNHTQSIVAIDEKVIYIKWAAVDDENLKHFNIYMDDVKVAELSPSTTEWYSPPLHNDREYEFIVTSTSTGDNESPKINKMKKRLSHGSIKEQPMVIDIETTVVDRSKQMAISHKDFILEFEVIE